MIASISFAKVTEYYSYYFKSKLKLLLYFRPAHQTHQKQDSFIPYAATTTFYQQHRLYHTTIHCFMQFQ